MQLAKLFLRVQLTDRHVLKRNDINDVVLNIQIFVTDTKQVQQQRNNVIIEICNVLLRDMHANRAEPLQLEIRLL
jgi:hypothetical protein